MIKRLYKRFLLWALAPAFEQSSSEVVWVRKPDPDNPWDMGEIAFIPKCT